MIIITIITIINITNYYYYFHSHSHHQITYSGPLRFEYAISSNDQLQISNTLATAEKHQILKNWKCTRSVHPDLFTLLRSEILSSTVQLDIEAT